MPGSSTAEILSQAIGTLVLVRLKGGREIRGKLRSFDQHMNLVLEEAEELKPQNKNRKLGTIIVRGDNVVLISPVK
ncbi:MAG: RNA-binding protein [Thermoprotei archaeon]|nr:MAG: RNA-binding protein [Thermoprotei archaeon]RLF23208.1 MAG: RNA-binding protein [Thermoprotei archaeon]